ncbi:MAG: PQQ-like beta-propeller repeat protein [Planctomycetales bacterium]|nr:PQQ-like beta-propeller repeat protein [Planctomycetales bacterium]
MTLQFLGRAPITALCLLIVLVSISLAEDWPQWRGPARDGVWEATAGILEQLPEGQLPLTWEVELGAGYCGPTVASGRVFVMDRITADGQQSERVLCFDSATGKEIWRLEYEAPYTISYTAGPRASVTIDGDRAYAVGAMGHFHCLDTATGEVKWKRDLQNEYDIDMPIWGIAASPLIYGELVIQQVAGKPNACIVAFDKSTGREVWRSLNERAGYSSPIVIKQAGQDVLVCWTGESLSGLDPLTGSVYWQHEMLPSRMPIGIGTPVLSGNQVFVSSFYDGSLMVRLSDDTLESRQVWRAVGPDEMKTESLHAMIGTCIVRDGYVFGFDSYGQFRCLDAATGERLWENLEAVPQARWATVHMVTQGDRVWMFNERGELLITRLSPTGLKILSRAKLIEPTTLQLNQRKGVCWSHPAFAEKSVFARNDNRLVRASLASH